MDNRGEAPFVVEHGFALWIETDDLCILLDTGQGSGFVENARVLGVDVSRADYIVLSHGHFDHTGGLADALSMARHAVVVYHEGIWKERYSIRDGDVHAIGMPERSRRALQGLLDNRKVLVARTFDLSNRVHVLTEITRSNDFEDTGGPFFLDELGQRPDLLEDDLTLWIETEAGLVVFTGCSHAGIVNICHAVQGSAPNQTFKTILGGFHLLNAGTRRLQKTVDSFRQLNPTEIVAGHCTGDAAIDILSDNFGDRFRLSHVGLQLSI